VKNITRNYSLVPTITSLCLRYTSLAFPLPRYTVVIDLEKGENYVPLEGVGEEGLD
jgi:hypothetical protein